MSKKNKMTPSAAVRIQATKANSNAGVVPKGSFAAKAQSAAAQNVNSGIVSPKS